MFGFGARSVGFGSKLALALVIGFLLLLVTQPGWLVYVQHPFQYAVPLLLVIGQILLVDGLAESVVSVLFSLAQGLGRRIDDRNKSEVIVAIEFHPDWTGCLSPMVSIVLFGAAVLLAPGLGLPWWTAAYGWLFAILAMLTEFSALPPVPTYQLANIEASEDSELVFLSVQNEVHGSLGTSIRTDWDGAVAYLNANGWELVETLQVNRKRRGRTCWDRTAHFRRLSPTSPLFEAGRRELQRFVFRY